MKKKSKPLNSSDIRIVNYDNIIFDCDGVILDSNEIKEKNIYEASSRLLGEPKLNKFIEHFNSNPGVPREDKIRKYVQDKSIIDSILYEYNLLNLESLKKANIVNGFSDFIQLSDYKQINKYVVSGGDQDELMEVFKYKDLINYFNQILGGPKSKIENIYTLNLTGNTIYFGDSNLDYLVSRKFHFDFVFVKGYTTKELIIENNSKNEIHIIHDFSEI